MNLSLHAQYSTLALEAQAGESSLRQALTRLPHFFKEVGKSLTEAFSKPFHAVFKAKDLNWAITQLAAVPYPTLRTTVVPCVPGLTTDYLSYIAALDLDAQHAAVLEAKYLNPLIDFLAKKLANPDALRSQAPDLALVAVDLTALNIRTKAMAGLVDPTNDSASQPYGKLIKRHADWTAIQEHIAHITKVFTQSDHARVAMSVARCNELLGTLIARVSEDPSMYKVSGPTLKLIADAAYATATAVEFYGLTYRRAVVLEAAIHGLVDTTAKLIPQAA